MLKKGIEGRSVWLGSASMDRSVGLNDYNGQFTHHIAPDIDAERDKLIADLIAAKMVTTTYEVSGVGPTLDGRNGEGTSTTRTGKSTLPSFHPMASPSPHPRRCLARSR